MARNSTLEKLLTDLRLEARLSSSPALNVQDRERQIQLLQREQFRLWEDFAWPHLRVERFIPVQAGQRFYDPAAMQNEAGAAKTDMRMDRIEKIDIKYDGVWQPLSNGITPAHYAAHDSALDQRSSPARAWRIYEDEQIEIWPVPDVDAGAQQEGYLRVTGIRNLRPLVNVADRADLDDSLIVLYAAGNILAGQNSPDAQLKMEAAQRHYARLRNSLSKSEGFNLFGARTAHPLRRPYVSRYIPASEA